MSVKLKDVNKHPFALTEKQRLSVSIAILALLTFSFFVDSDKLSWFAIGAFVGSILSHNSLLNPFTLWNLWRNRSHREADLEVVVHRHGRSTLNMAGSANLIAEAVERELLGE